MLFCTLQAHSNTNHLTSIIYHAYGAREKYVFTCELQSFHFHWIFLSLSLSKPFSYTFFLFHSVCVSSLLTIHSSLSTFATTFNQPSAVLCWIKWGSSDACSSSFSFMHSSCKVETCYHFWHIDFISKTVSVKFGKKSISLLLLLLLLLSCCCSTFMRPT